MRDVRLQTVGDGALALELNLAIPSTGGLGTVEAPRTGWAADIPAETVLGLMQAAALDLDDETAAFAVLPFDVQIHPDGFDVGLRVWSRRRHNRFTDFRVHGVAQLDEQGHIVLEATEALLEDTSTKNIDVLTLLLKKKILQSVASALTTSIPGHVSGETKGSKARLAISELQLRNNALRVLGDVQWIED